MPPSASQTFLAELSPRSGDIPAVAEQSERYTNARRWIPQRWADPKAIIEELNSILVA